MEARTDVREPLSLDHLGGGGDDLATKLQRLFDSFDAQTKNWIVQFVNADQKTQESMIKSASTMERTALQMLANSK